MFISDFGQIQTISPVLTSTMPVMVVPRLGSRCGYLLGIEPARGTHQERLPPTGVLWVEGGDGRLLENVRNLYSAHALPNGTDR